MKGKGQGSNGFIWEVPKFRLQKFRRTEDIINLRTGTYGIPYRANFPLIDAIVQPDKVINFTITKIHKGANQDVESLRKKHKFIWMVEDPEKFSKQEGLGDIKQYVMCSADSRN